ncbi:MAG: AraC family transcriptional regulator [Akkermansiaceae bacterium]|nr:AraC family transcriptional regulator [Akkermansiaceae bacterium]
MKATDEIRETFFRRFNKPLLTEKLFDQVPDIAFFIKDHLGRYVAANNTLVKRSGVENKEALIGKTAQELFPGPLGAAFSEQDRQVLKTALRVHGRLELHLHPNGSEGWCITYKEPIFDDQQLIIGVSGISQDIRTQAQGGDSLTAIADVLKYIRENLDQPLRLPDLASMARLSIYQLDQRIRALYQLSAGQLITRARIEAACHRLSTSSRSIANIALECGYSDQSAFTRQFKQTTGLTPKAYRDNRII